MASLVITVNTEMSAQTLVDELTWSSSPRVTLTRCAEFLQAIGSGHYNGGVTIGIGSSDPVRASGTLTVVNASLNATDTVTVAGQVLTCVASNPAANQFVKGATGTDTATNLAAAINASSAAGARVSATSAAAVVTVSANQAGTVGNLLGLVSSGAGVTVSGANLASGAGGASSSPLPISYTYGKVP